MRAALQQHQAMLNQQARSNALANNLRKGTRFGSGSLGSPVPSSGAAANLGPDVAVSKSMDADRSTPGTKDVVDSGGEPI